MSDFGKLCYKNNSKYLACNNSNGALIFKSPGISECTVRIVFNKFSWVCTTYQCYHEIFYSATGTWTSGSGTIASSYSVRDSAEFKIRPSNIVASTFTVTVTATTECAAIEYEEPGASCFAVAVQSSGESMTVQCPPNEGEQIRIEFDEFGTLTRIY